MNNEMKRGGEFKYSSTQLDLNTEDRKEVQEFIESIIEPDDVYEEFGIEKDSHITVLYGIHDYIVTDKLRELTVQTLPIKVMLGKTSLFDTNPDYDVLKLDIISGDLRKLNKLLVKNIEHTNDYPLYVPHLTLAYLKKGMGEKYINNTTFENKVITFDRLTFSPRGIGKSYLYFGNN